MSQVEAPSGARAVCRECGSTIDPAEPRFAREEGRADARRTRWRHLACAAQRMPNELRSALEFGGWDAVSSDDHEELRAMIERARAILAAGQRGEAQAARSGSAMAAAAVLEPAHEAEQLSPEQARAWVFADALQARGDARGELLALELAAEHTLDPGQARALQREHRGCWQAFAASLRASKDLRLRWVGGFLLGAHPKARRELHRLFASAAARELARVRVDFCTQDELQRLVHSARSHARPLSAVELPNSRHSDLAPLAELDSLSLLRVGGRFDPSLLTKLDALRGLSLADPGEMTTAQLGPQLELLELGGIAAEHLDGLAARLPRLRHLRLRGVALDGGLDCLAGAEQLHSLYLPESPLRELGPLPGLPQLRELLITPGTLRLVRELDVLTKLERLALHGSKVGELDALAALERCEQLALVGTRATALGPLRQLPRLRSLAIEGGDMRRVTKLERLTGLEQLELSKLVNLDLAQLRALERLDTLTLVPGGHRPKQLETLAELPQLRRLSMPLELLSSVSRPAHVLANIEVLELRDGQLPPQSLLDALPRLRRLLLPGCDPALIEVLAEANPDVAVFADAAPRDLLDRRDPFDWRDVGWVPAHVVAGGSQ